MLDEIRHRLSNVFRAFHGHMDPTETPQQIESDDGTTDSIFVSYSHRDSGIVRQFSAYLDQEEIPPWIDNQLKYGESWEDVIVKRILRSSVVLILMSPDANESEYVHKELDLALAENKIVIPILLRGEPFDKAKNLMHIKLLDTIHTKTDFVEQIRDLIAPSIIPGSELQQRRIRDFCIELFGMIEGIQATNVHLGFGLDVDRGITMDYSIAKFDELDWAEVFTILREKLPHKELGYAIGKDYSAQFPTVNDFANFLYEYLSWEDIRRLSGKP